MVLNTQGGLPEPQLGKYSQMGLEDIELLMERGEDGCSVANALLWTWK